MRKMLFSALSACTWLLASPSVAIAADADRVAIELYSRILSGRAEELEKAFATEPRIDTPRTGPLRGEQQWRQFVVQEAQWLKSLGARPESLRAVKTTRAPGRVVHEIVLDLAQPSRVVPFKMAVVVDDVRGSASAARVYYAYADTAGNGNFLRASILPSDTAAHALIPQPVRKYFDAIAASDQLSWKRFTPDGYFNGGGSVPLTGVGLKKFYAVLGGEPGGVPLSPATVTCDAQTCAIEENLAGWGSIVFERDTAGLAVYDYDAATSLLKGARVYDDIGANPFTKPGWIASNWRAISDALATSGCKLTYRPKAEDPPAKVLGDFFTAPCAQ
jgi:hypothetical protein